jgi:hypothetical protein
MKTSEATLAQRAGYLYRHLLLLQRLFQGPDENDTAEWLTTGDEAEALALRAGIREVLDELTEQSRVLTTVPFPLRDWRPGDGTDDERWRALTEVERREVLSLVSGYENLITWAEGQAYQRFGLAERYEWKGADVIMAPHKPPRDPNETTEYLKAERARVARFRQDMGFLNRRRTAETAKDPLDRHLADDAEELLRADVPNRVRDET